MKRAFALIVACLTIAAVAKSAPSQFNWVKHPGNPILTEYYPDHPCVVRVGDTLYMFYTYSPNPQNIRLATSIDSGKTWTNQGDSITTSSLGLTAYSDLATGSIRYENGQFELYYRTGGGWCSIGLATSADGRHWIDQGEAIHKEDSGWESGAIGPAFVFRDADGVRRMLYSGTPGFNETCYIGLATYDSVAGQWQRCPENPIIGPGGSPDNFDSSSTWQAGSVIYSSGMYYFFYSGYRTGYSDIDLGWATSTDLIHWTKHGRIFELESAQTWEVPQRIAPDVIVDGGLLRMFYGNGAYAIGLATSTFCDCPNQGDISLNGLIDVFDVIGVIGIAFSGDPDPQDYWCPRTRGDVNNDGLTDVFDVIYLVDHAFSGGPAPVDPCAP